MFSRWSDLTSDAMIGAPRARKSTRHSGDRASDYEVVRGWITADSTEAFSVQGLIGVTEIQGAHLGRLSALILRALAESPKYERVVHALTGPTKAVAPTSVYEAFERLARADALTHLATLYADVVKATNRRTLGTFFTPAAEAASMVTEYAAHHPPPQRVVDVGAGVGVFSAAVRDRWNSAVVEAIDINPVTLGLQAVALNALGDETIDLVLSDYSSWLASREADLPTLFLGNPPYTRWQLIAKEDRDALLEATQGLVGARANLSTIFLAITLLKLGPADGLSMIVPAGWLSAAYAGKLRAHVRTLTARQITLRLADSWRFEGAVVDAVVVEVGPEAQGGACPLQITDWPGATRTMLSRPANDEAPFVREAPSPRRSARSAGRPLSDYGRFSRGIATGANRFFVRPAEHAVEDGIDPKWLTSIVRRMRPGASALEPAVEISTLLNLKDFQRGDDAIIDDLITSAVRDGVSEGYLCTARGERWFDLSAEIWIPDVIISSLSRDTFHLHVNTARRAMTNNLFGWTWHESATSERRQAILDWLRSEDGQQALAESAAREANELHRLSPRALSKVIYPQTG